MFTGNSSIYYVEQIAGEMSNEEMSTNPSNNGNAEQKRNLRLQYEMFEDEYSGDQEGQYDSETKEDRSMHEQGHENERKRDRSEKEILHNLGIEKGTLKKEITEDQEKKGHKTPSLQGDIVICI